MKFLDFRKAFSKTREVFLGRLKKTQNLDEVEEALYLVDLGSKTVELLMRDLRKVHQRFHSSQERADFYQKTLKEKALDIFEKLPSPSFSPSLIFSSQHGVSQALQTTSPQLWMFVGVNGVGKTTCIGKLAFYLAQKHKVLVAAGDTFRPAASDQLKVWSQKAGVDFFEGSKEPAALAFQASQYALSKGYEFMLLDTAGRLSHHSHLMEELKKVKRVVQKVLPSAPQGTFVVLDAHAGQNSLLQAQSFHKALSLTGIILNKLDGSAKGGVILSLAHELKIPIYWLGVGEKQEDLKPFHSQEFVNSLFDELS